MMVFQQIVSFCFNISFNSLLFKTTATVVRSSDVASTGTMIVCVCAHLYVSMHVYFNTHTCIYIYLFIYLFIYS